FGGPMKIHELPETMNVSRLQCLPNLRTDLFDLVQQFGLGVFVFNGLLLIRQNVRRAALDAGVEKQQIAFELRNFMGVEPQRRRFHASLAVYIKTSDSAKGRDVLVLLADRFLEDLNLDLIRLFGQILRGHALALIGVERQQKAHGERSGTSQSRV